MTRRIRITAPGAALCLLALAVVTADWATRSVVRCGRVESLVERLTGQGRMLAIAAPDILRIDRAAARTMAEAGGARLTIIRSDGTVAADSEENPAEAEGPGGAPEVTRALGGNTGWAERGGSLYVAVPLERGAVRLALPLDRMEADIARLRGRIRLATALAFLPAIVIGGILSRWVSQRFRAEMRRTVEQFEREHAELERAERIRKDFVINVSHELRTPLASIQGYTETLLDGALGDPENNLRFLRIIRHNAERLARITEDLLTLSRIEQKRQRFEFEPHPVNSILEDALDLMRPIAQRNRISLGLDPAPETAEAWCDLEAVAQILSNLLDNAIKYTPAGGSITIGARPRERFVEVWVRDTGIGIPAEDLPRLFERFYRVDKARSRELGGTGLGLSIVKHLVAAHGGATRVESRVNDGSTFYFTLPAEEPAAQAELNPEFTAS